MKLTRTLTSGSLSEWFRFIPVAALAVSFGVADLQAQPQPGKAEVRAVKGSAFYTLPGANSIPLKAGTILSSGATITTGEDSIVDLFLGNSAGVLRIWEDTTLALDKLALTDTGADTVVDVQLNLPKGTILGNVNKLGAASKYEIKSPRGVAGIRGTSFRFSDTGFTVLLEGVWTFVYVGADGQLTPYTLTAPPPVYFSPLEGVKPAPDDLVREVLEQMGRQDRRRGPPEAVPPFEPFVSPGTGKRPTGQNPGGQTPGPQ